MQAQRIGAQGGAAVGNLVPTPGLSKKTTGGVENTRSIIPHYLPKNAKLGRAPAWSSNCRLQRYAQSKGANEHCK